MDFHLYVLLLG